MERSSAPRERAVALPPRKGSPASKRPARCLWRRCTPCRDRGRARSGAGWRKPAPGESPAASAPARLRRQQTGAASTGAARQRSAWAEVSIGRAALAVAKRRYPARMLLAARASMAGPDLPVLRARTRQVLRREESRSWPSRVLARHLGRGQRAGGGRRRDLPSRCSSEPTMPLSPRLVGVLRTARRRWKVHRYASRPDRAGTRSPAQPPPKPEWRPGPPTDSNAHV